MKKYSNFILMVLITLVLAIVAKIYFKEFGYMQLHSSTNVNRYLFNSYIALSLLIILFISYYGIYILMHNNKIDRENIPEAFEKKVEVLLYLLGMWGNLSFIALAITVNGSFYLELKQFGRIPTYSLGVVVVLLLVLTKYYNYLFPNLKINPLKNQASEKLFDKLDEGQKWIAYKCSHDTFNIMNTFYYMLFMILLILSVFIEIPLVLPIAVITLRMIQDAIYNFKTKKYKYLE